MKSIKALVRRTCPEIVAGIDRARLARIRRRLRAMVREFAERCGTSVQAGPFAGMVLAPSALNDFSLPKLLGCYESELHEFIGELHGYSEIINIGCAEGYYAVGLARRFPSAMIYAFDSDPQARAWCTGTAEANGVSQRLVLGGACDLEQLQALAPHRPLVWCDCEGCEYAILRPDRVSWLSLADLVVELHEAREGERSGEFLDRFRGTHDVRIARFGDQPRAMPPIISFWPPAQRKLAVSEYRSQGLKWAFLRSRTGRTPVNCGI